jgi:hypothetical protein
MLVGYVIIIGGYTIPITSATPDIQYGGTFLIAVGIFPCPPLAMGWLSNNLSLHHIRATARDFKITVANTTAFIATFTYLGQDA